MSTLLAAIGRTLTRRWKFGLLGIIASFVLVGAIVGSQSGSAAEDFAIPGTETQRALDLLQQRFPAAAGATSTVVFTTQDGTLRDPAKRAALKQAIAEIDGLPHVSGASDPLQRSISRDGRTAFSTVQYDRQQVDLTKRDGEQLIDAARTAQHDGVRVELRGPVVDLASQESAPVGELIGIAIAIVLLTLLFRSWAAMLTTLLGALIGVAFSQLILAAVSEPIGIPDFAKQLAVMLGLGAGIDYALLILSRYREQIARGDSPEEASARASATSGVSVVAAGAIVMVAIAGLMTIGIPLVGKMGIGAAIAVAMVVGSSITVLPVFAGMLKRFLTPKDPAHVDRSEAFGRWGERITRHPVRAVAAGTALLLIIAIPMTGLRLGQPDDGNQPTSTTQRKAYDQLSAAFGPGFNGPFLLAVDRKDGGRIDGAQLQRLRATLARTKGVAAVAAPVLNPKGDAAILNVIPTTSPQAEGTSDLVTRLRDGVLPPVRAAAGLNVYVGGQTAAFEDFSAKISARLPIFIAIVCGLSILLLMAVFRSIWVPLASAVFNLLSIGAAYGVVVAVFQKGWGASLIGASSDVPIVSFIPLFMFAILFGLSMDYNVFLLSRIREAYFEGDSPRESVIHGLSRIAKIILVAGLVMASVFLAFVAGNDIIIKMFGIGLGAAILIDVLIVRMLISPALMTLLGDRAWWIPRWLDRVLPNISLEGHHEARDEAMARREKVAA